MDIIPTCVFMALFLIGGLKDLNRRKIDDYTSSFLWIAYALTGHELFVLVASFGFLWLITNFIEDKTGKVLMAWADLLWAPVMLAVMTEMANFQIALAIFGITLLIGQGYLLWTKSKNMPFVLMMAASLWALFLSKLIIAAA